MAEWNEKKLADGYDVLEVPKGTWVEAIFAKLKPEAEKPRMKFQSESIFNDGEDDEEGELPIDDYKNHDEEDEEMEEPTTFDDEEINEDNYRTTFEIETDPDEEADGLEDYVDE